MTRLDLIEESPKARVSPRRSRNSTGICVQCVGMRVREHVWAKKRLNHTAVFVRSMDHTAVFVRSESYSRICKIYGSILVTSMNM